MGYNISEQVMQIVQTLSGFTAGEADILRRAMGKKRAERKAEKNNGAENNGIAKDIAAEFRKIEPFNMVLTKVMLQPTQ